MGLMLDGRYTVTKGFEYQLWATSKKAKTIVELSIGKNGVLQCRDAATQLKFVQATIEAAAGETLYLAAMNAMNANVDATANAVFTITGTTSGTSISGTATMPKDYPYGTMIEVAPTSPGHKWKTITNVTCVGGVYGDSWELISLPAQSAFTRLAWVTSVDLGEATSWEAIPNGYNPADHYKRVRPTGEFSMNTKYLYPFEGAEYFAGRNLVIRLDNMPDGTLTPDFQRFVDGVRFGAPLSVPENEGEATVNVSGNYRKYMTPLVPIHL